MNTRTAYALIAILAAVGTLSASQAFAQINPACPDCEQDTSREQAIRAAQGEIPIIVWTDKSVYDHESTIQITGKVANVKPSVPVTIKVTGPQNNVVTIQQIDIKSDGTFATTLNTAGNLWKYDGTYQIRVQYGSQEVNNRVLVDLIGATQTSTVTCGAGELPIASECVSYSITGGKVTGVNINSRDNSFVVKIDSTNDGTFTINPSEAVIRGVFMVLVDGEEWDDRTIDGNKVTVMFPAGTEEIEIVGTFVIPEFGTIAALVLAVAIISIIAVSARSRLGIMPKY